jgi:glycine/D-amino acid oxidase-like deaminating enzyme
MVGGDITDLVAARRLWPILESPICILSTLHFVCSKDAQLWLWLSLSYEGHGYSRERCIELLRKIEEIAEQVEREWAAWAQLKEFEVAVYADLERISAPVV